MKKIILTVFIILFSNISLAKSINSYIEEAESGNSDSAFKLGMIYEFGIKNKVDRDISKAINYYEIAAEERNYKAISRLGVIEYNRANYKKAIEYFKSAAQNDEPLAEAYLGKIIEERSESPEGALKFYESSANKNNPYGKMFLGEYLIKNSKKGSEDFIKGYAVLVSASKQNEEAKNIIKRHPYNFSESDKEVLKKYIIKYQ